MAKRLNPIVERRRGYLMEGEQIEFVHGPDLSEQGLRDILFAVHSGAHFAMFALREAGGFVATILTPVILLLRAMDHSSIFDDRDVIFAVDGEFKSV
jgi:hypothetical protein